MLTTEVAVWIFDLLASLNIQYEAKDIDIESKESKKNKIKDSIRDKQARVFELPTDIYRRRTTWTLTEYI